MLDLSISHPCLLALTIPTNRPTDRPTREKKEKTVQYEEFRAPPRQILPRLTSPPGRQMCQDSYVGGREDHILSSGPCVWWTPGSRHRIAPLGKSYQRWLCPVGPVRVVSVKSALRWDRGRRNFSLLDGMDARMQS